MADNGSDHSGAGGSDASAPRVGFVGLGNMGWPMAAHVAAAGLPLRVHNRTRSKAEAFVEHVGGDVRICETPAEAAAGSDAVLSIVSDDAAATEVFTGPDGVAAGIAPGAVGVEMSTISPGCVRRLAGVMESVGASLVDAPAGGSVSTAEAGVLLMIAGGGATAVEQARPALEPFSGRIAHVGGQGSGAAMKLALNTLVHGLVNSVAEGLVLAEGAGIDRQVAYDVFAASPLGSPFFQYRRDWYERPGTQPAIFRLDLAIKDLRLALDLAAEVGLDLPQIASNHGALQAASAAGFGDYDVAGVAESLRGKRRSAD
ncbi:MAG: NAD(P)-dependent oxidoreductase [bacterium]|nr:NAD(P)-dependent oxidoreductase [bacterium]